MQVWYGDSWLGVEPGPSRIRTGMVHRNVGCVLRTLIG